MDVVKQAVKNLHRTASVCPTTSTRLTYRDLLLSADRISQSIHKTNGGASSMSDHQPPRVGLFATPGPEYLAASMAVWKSGGIVVPLATSHPPRELAYVLSDAGIKTVLTGKGDASKLCDVTSEVNAQLVLMDTIEPSTTSLPSSHSADFGSISPSSGALIIYTSGTTGKPKGVLHTHGSISAQVQGLVEAWQWSMEDRILHTLPLHHIHGIVNALYCPAFVGAQIQFLPKFSPSTVWQKIVNSELSVFMGVPTMYSFLLNNYDSMSSEEQGKAREAASRLRLTVSGSSACPVPVMNRWKELTGRWERVQKQTDAHYILSS